jgi:cyclophilin family peptidyl-prolyl cis-trans isomerase/HEAT repeat protein
MSTTFCNWHDMIPDRRAMSAALLGAMLLLAGCTAPDAGRPDRQAEGYLRIVAAEDARPAEGADLELLITMTSAADVLLRRSAVRALGRLENPVLVEEIAHHLADPDTSVRSEAANALAQAVHRTDGESALRFLLAAIESEESPAVLGSLARSLGRLRVTGSDLDALIAAILDVSVDNGGPAAPAVMQGAALGLESVVRISGAEALGDRAAGRLDNMASYRGPDQIAAVRVRSVAISALRQAGRLSARTVELGMRDVATEVRAASAAGMSVVAPNVRTELIRRAIGDPSVTVPIAAINQIVREPQDSIRCEWLVIIAERAPTDAVRVPALDALSRPCPQPVPQQRALVAVASRLGSATDPGWLAPSRALVSLATVAPELADELVPFFVQHPNAFVRGYGARAAGLIGRRDLLGTLAADEAPNVRTIALQILALDGLVTDEQLVGHLASDDPQLLMTVAGLMEGSSLGFPAGSAAMTAFERISAMRRETTRDARRALLARVEELGTSALAGRMEPFLQDFDPQVAEDAARILSAWQGRDRQANPQAPDPVPLPTATELRELERTTVTLHMQRGDSIVIRPLPYLALTNSHRFVRLAREGYFDGLTFHRWVPNFVIQGGSPGANESAGDGPYTRDEVSLLPHWRGTVGLSTRGHDTGDGQIFINLIDNVRLNHDYTIYGVVTSEMDVVDAVVEGDVILRAEVRIGG